MIEVKGISKQYGALKAVENLSFVAPDGEITALLGVNGAGKTTSLRMIYSLIKPESGSVSIDGFNPHKTPQKALSRLGVLPDARGLYTRLTAEENIHYFGQLHGMSKHQLKQRTAVLVESLDMNDIIHRKTEGFSQGQRVKVALARALIHDPPNIILDEPTNGLDVLSTRSLRRFLLAERMRGKCIVFSSHIMQEVAAVSDNIVVMHGGSACAHGSERYLMEQSETDNLEDAFVALTYGERECGQ